MKKSLLSAALTVGLAGSAMAADLPVKAAPMMAAPVAYSWTGCYVGGGIGYGMYNQDVSTVNVSATTGAVTSASANETVGGRGWLGTVQVGCDYQFADRWVLGVFGDYTWSGMKGTLSWPRGAATFLSDERNKDNWAIGGRVGYVVLPGLLAYVSGGYTESRYTFGGIGNAFTGAPGTVFLPDTKYKGWFLGSGYEYGISFIPGLFWKSEYRYASYQSRDIPFLDTTTGAFTNAYLHTSKYEQTVRSELVYRFNWGGGPVVAKY